MRTELDKLEARTQLTLSQSTKCTEGGAHASRRPHNAAKAARTQKPPNCVNYNLVNEQEQRPPQRIHVRHQDNQSPQISVTFLHFNSLPFIWCRGPRPKAHWHMHADGTNYRKCHMEKTKMSSRYTETNVSRLSLNMVFIRR